MTGRVRAEEALLLACATWERSSTRTMQVRAATGNADWERFLGLARDHRLVPHVHRQIALLDDVVPATIRAMLHDETRAIGLRSLLMARQLAEIADAFERADVSVIAFKGPALSLAAYGDLGARSSMDLDIVVTPPALNRARSLLHTLGYESRARMSPSQERTLQRSFGHYVYTRDAGPSPVELHWSFSSARYPWTLPPADVVRRATRVAIGEAGVPAPDVHDDVILQAMHGARHQWEQLEWLVVFSERLSPRASWAPDPRVLLERAAAQRSTGAFLLGVWLADHLIGAAVPAALHALARDDATVVRLGREIVDRFYRGAPPYTAAENRAFCLDLIETPGARVRFLADEVFLPTMREWELVQLPEPLLPLYVPIRLGRLAWRAFSGEDSGQAR